MTGFKEWALVCDALGRGEQSIILRKGGIAEGRTGFRFQHDEFLLFPTLFHEQVARLKLPPETPLPARAAEGQIEIRHAVRVEWTPLWSLTHEAVKYLPTAFCYFGSPDDPAAAFCGADSNGNAAGSSPEDAVLQGFFELVERDSVALWWYNRLRRPAVDLASVAAATPYVARLRDM